MVSVIFRFLRKTGTRIGVALFVTENHIWPVIVGLNMTVDRDSRLSLRIGMKIFQNLGMGTWKKVT